MVSQNIKLQYIRFQL